MHIVIATAFDPIPSDGISVGRYYHLSMALKAHGHEVHFLTSRFSHASKTFRSEKEEETEGIKYTKVKSPGYTKNISLARLLDHFLLALQAKKTIAQIHAKKSIDLVLCASPPLHWCNYILKFCRKNKIKSVLDIQDNWPKAFEYLSPIAYQLSCNALPLQLVRIHNITMANAVTSVAAGYLPDTPNKTKAVFYLGAPVQEMQQNLSGIAGKGSDKLRLVYMGNISSHQPLLEFLNTNQHENLQVTYIGTCEDERIKQHPLIQYKGSLYHENLYQTLANNDFGLFINDRYKEIKLPNKLFYYWACGLPVLGLDIEGESATLIQEMDGLILNNRHLKIPLLQVHLSAINKERIKILASKKYDEKIIYPAFVTFLEQLVKQN